MRYRVTVDDPDTWTSPWTAEVPLVTSAEQMFEYACHEANYSMEDALRGMRAKEKDDEARSTKK